MCRHLLAVLLLTAPIGCDALWYVRMDVREGPEMVKRIPLSQLDSVAGQPVEGVRVKFCCTDGTKYIHDTVFSRSDGVVEYIVLGPPWGPSSIPMRFTCTKQGYVTVKGECELASPRRDDTVLVIIRRATHPSGKPDDSVPEADLPPSPKSSSGQDNDDRTLGPDVLRREDGGSLRWCQDPDE